MQSVWISKFGAPDVLELREVGKPMMAPDQILVRVRASALNRADLLQRQGKYPPPPGFPQEIPGIEFAGEVADCGPAVRLWKPGQRVFGLLGGGAQAEYIVTHERLVAQIPDNLDWAQAASVPEVFITAHDALWSQAGLRPGETVLINAVGSGVGLAAVQLVRAMHGVPYGTSRTPDKIKQASHYGLEAGLTVRDNFDELVAAADKWTSGKGINVVLDLAGGPYMKAFQKLAALKGRIMLVGSVAGGTYELDARQMFGKRLTVRGTALRARSLEEKIQVTQTFASEVVPLLAAGTLRTVIDSTFPMSEIAKAHARLESNETFGKVVVMIE